jgi:hypothetical protein
MSPWASAVDLEFESGEPRAGHPVYAVEAHGHYRILVPAEGAADRPTFERLVSQPGAFGRWALLGLRREIMNRAGEVAAAYRPSATTAFMPPNAKELESAYWTEAGRARLGTTSSAHSGSGSW